MQLEKVTSRSGQAALAGWISSNDVTLFTTVLVLAIAMFLHARLSKGAKENVQITHAKNALAQQLEATASARDASNNLLNETRRTLNLTKDERDRLEKQLADKLADISQLNAKLDVLLGEKVVLESQRQSLIATKESLSKEKMQLLAQQSSLGKDRDSLKTVNANLLQKIDSITAQLSEKVTALEQVEQQRERLKKQADELDTVVASLKQRLDKLNTNLAMAQAHADASAADSRTKIHELETQIADRDKAADEYLAKLKRAASILEGVRLEKQQLEQRFTAAELQHQAQLLEESRNNRELVGLTGRLDRVAVLFDASGSMRQASASGGSDRWAEAQQIAATWLQHLNVQQCVLIVFSTGVQTFPNDGALADLRGAAGKTRREALLQYVKQLTPSGRTNTFDALRTAYQYPVDAILLFSDGAPSGSDTGRFDPAAAQQIYDLCRAHPNIPVHTVGLGNYFDQDASTFLQSVAKLTGGTFRGN